MEMSRKRRVRRNIQTTESKNVMHLHTLSEGKKPHFEVRLRKNIEVERQEDFINSAGIDCVARFPKAAVTALKNVRSNP